MGQAKNRGTFEERKDSAIDAGRSKGSHRSGQRKQYIHHAMLGATAHDTEIMAMALATLAFGRGLKKKRSY